MLTHEIQIRVRYAETDQMSYVYYGNYAAYFEVARVETFRSFGLSYKAMEEMGVMMPVLEYTSKFIRPAKYDDLLTIKIYIKTKPGVRIVFDYEVFNEEGVLLNVSQTTLVFVNIKTNKPCLPPPEFQHKLESYFTEA